MFESVFNFDLFNTNEKEFICFDVKIYKLKHTERRVWTKSTVYAVLRVSGKEWPVPQEWRSPGLAAWVGGSSTFGARSLS